VDYCSIVSVAVNDHLRVVRFRNEEECAPSIRSSACAIVAERCRKRPGSFLAQLRFYESGESP
jgi:hypothetical protein